MILQRHLSERQQQVALLIHVGHMNKEIAGLLGLKESTVKRYTTQIYNRLNLARKDGNARTQLCTWVRKELIQ